MLGRTSAYTSALAIQLQSGAGVLGVMSLYAHRRDTFDDHTRLIGEQFAVPATVAVYNAQVLVQVRRCCKCSALWPVGQ